jgi:hypothetical protein
MGHTFYDTDFNAGLKIQSLASPGMPNISGAPRVIFNDFGMNSANGRTRLQSMIKAFVAGIWFTGWRICR